jgi:hypothetical protein
VAPRQVIAIERAAVQNEVTNPGLVFQRDEHDAARSPRALPGEHEPGHGDFFPFGPSVELRRGDDPPPA